MVQTTDGVDIRPDAGVPVDTRRWLQGAALLVGLVWLPIILRWGVLPHALTFDDAWYYFQIGRNIADGAGSTLDGLHTTNGYHPLWMLLTAAVYGIGFDDLAAVRAILVVQLALWVTALWVLGSTVATAVAGWPQLRGRDDAEAGGRRGTVVLAGLWFLVGANPYVLKLFVNGMETGLAALLGAVLLAMSAHHRGDPLHRPVVAAAVCGLAFLARTDAVFLIGSLLCWSAVLRRRVDRTVLAVGAAVAVIGALYVGSNLLLVGHPLQISGVTKRVDLDAIRAITAVLCLAAGAGIAVAGLRLRRPSVTSKLPRTRAWLGNTAWWPAGCLVLLAYEWGLTTEIYLWHYAPQALWGIATLAHAVADIVEGVAAERPASQPGAATRSAAVAFILLLPFVAGGLWLVRSFRDPELRSLQLGDRRAAEWMAVNLPADAVVGSWDAGVVAYFAERPVVNLDGLVNSYDWYEARREGPDATQAFLRAAGISHVANHGVPTGGDEPGLRQSIDRLLGVGGGAGSTLVHREDYVFSGTAGGRSGRRPYATFVYELPSR